MKKLMSKQGWPVRLIIIGVTAAILFIGIIQYRWMIQSVESEQERQIRSFIVSISRALRTEIKDIANDLYWLQEELPFAETQIALALNIEITNLPKGLITGASILDKKGRISNWEKSTQSWTDMGISNNDWQGFLQIFFREDDRAPQEAIFFPKGFKLPSDTIGNIGLIAKMLPGDETIAIYKVDLNILLADKILPTLANIFNNHEITFSLIQSEEAIWEAQNLSRDLNISDSRNFSPWRAIFRNSSKERSLYFHYRSDFHLDSDDNEFARDMIMGYLRPPKPEEEGSNEGILIKLTPKGLSMIHQMERKLAFNWLLSEILLMGLGGAFFLLLYQRQRIKEQQLKEREFVAAITHELRTPLTVIQSAADNIKAGIVSEERLPEYGNLITTQTQRLGEMIEGILLFSRMEGRKDTAGPDRKMTPDELRESLTRRIPLGKNGVNIDFGSLPIEFYCDTEGIELILGNLLTNGLTHAYKTDGPIRVHGHVKLPSEIIFTVEDKGFGIPQKEQKQLFSPFYRGGRSRENHIKGSGLGLYLASRRAVTIGGRLTLESPITGLAGNKMNGCKFTLTIPFKELDNGN